MRIKAVLRDSDILSMTPGSRERIEATARKNVGRVVNMNSLLKVMGLKFSDRLQAIKVIEDLGLSIWLANEGDQHVIFISEGEAPDEPDFVGYRWS